MAESSVVDSKPIRHRVTTSGAWMIIYSVTGRLSRFVGQLALAWLLVPEQFGLIGIATSMSALAGIVGQFGLSDVLVNRYRRFHLWSSAGFTLSFVLGLCNTALLLILAVAASVVYGDRNLGWVVAVMSITPLISAAGLLSYAKLRAEMNFRQIAIVQSLGIILQMGSAIVFASLGFGIFCIACARLLETIFRTHRWIHLANLKLPRKWTLARTKYLMTESMHVYVQSLCNNVVMQSDYLLLGIFTTKAIVGLYFMAYSLSVQAISLVALNLNTVLFSAFNSFSSSSNRLSTAFIRSSKLLAFACTPLCIMQVVLAAPVIHLVLQPEWHDIVPLVQVLSIGTAFRCASISWESLLKAQRRFALVAKFSVFAAALFLGVIAVGCYLGEAMGCAIACALYHVVISPLQIFVTLGFKQGSLKQVLDLCLRSLSIAAVSFSVSWLLATPARNAHLLPVEMAIEIIVGIGMYWRISLKVNPEPCKDFTEVIMRIIKKKMKTNLPPST